MTDFKEYSELFHAADRQRGSKKPINSSAKDPYENDYRRMYEYIYTKDSRRFPAGSYYLQIFNTLKNKFGDIENKLGVTFSAEDKKNIKSCYDYVTNPRNVKLYDTARRFDDAVQKTYDRYDREKKEKELEEKRRKNPYWGRR